MEPQHVRRPEGPQDWEAQRAVITDLYITKGLELEDLMKTMEENHYFKATKKQYKTHFTNWDLRKNVRPSEYNAIIKKKRKREEEGKDSAFRLRGALVDDSKIVRYEKKTKRGDEREIAEAGTPEDLSCFTPSPVASSPNAPSPVPLHFPSPNLLRSWMVSPSKQILAVPRSLLLSPEDPDLEVNWIFFTSITPLEVSAWGRWVSLTLNDIIKAVTCQRMERFESDLSHYPVLHSLLTRLLSGFIERIRERMTFSRLRRSDIEDFLKKKPGQESGNLYDYVIQLKPAPTGFETEKFLRTLRINFITTSSDAHRGLNGFKISVTALGYQIVANLPGLTRKDLEQMHNPRVRRSESCESIRSFDSFLSDPVVDWKDLLYGYNREAASKEREF